VLKEMRAQAEKTTLPIEQRLRAMQEIVSYYIYSTNNPRLPGALDTPIGLVPMVLLRSGIYGLTGEDLVELNDKELSRDELGQLAGMIASIRWGNCREKAYLGAYAASLIPEVKQIVVVGMFVKGVGEHAAAIACLDGPEVYDMRNYGGTILGPPPGSEGRCFVVDPWAPAFNKLEPGKGHTALLTNDYASNASWEQVIVTKPIRLDGTIRAPLGGATMKVCAGGNDGEPSCSAPQPDPGAGDTGDAGTGGGFDAGGGGDAGGGVDAGPECPVYAPDGKECGASLEGCIEGFYCSTDTIACEQTECPEGSGRTYTLECCCNCWDDHSKVNVYDPCRAGFLIRCDPAP
jgi:hypothetical protein